MNEAKVEEIEDKFSQAIHDYIDVRKLYKNELRSIHVYKERIAKLEAKVQTFEDEIKSLKDQLTQVEQRMAPFQVEEGQGTSMPAKDIVEALV